MDFIDPHKRRQRKAQLLIGYVLIVIAILLTTLILLFLAYGYSLGKNGQIIQNGLVFASSTPNPAQIYLNGSLNKNTTNTRLQLPAGQYTLKLTRSGYRPWVRALGVEGGSVQRFDYPFLFPSNLVTTNVQQYTSQPGLVTQSPDQHWLLIQQPGSAADFYEYDLNNQKQLASTLTTISVPNTVMTTTIGAQAWQLVDWASDNRHVILQHIYQGGNEYILLDRQTPADSVNLTKTLGLSSTMQLSLSNKKYDQYHLYDTSTGNLTSATLSSVQPIPVLSGVLAFKSYGDSTLLYATSDNAPPGETNIDVRQGSKTYIIQQLPITGTYLLNLTQYSGSWYIALGSSSENKVYIYKDPMAALADNPKQPVVPIYILKVYQPNYVAFSNNAQFILAEGGNDFAVYDAENEKGYSYSSTTAVPTGQHAGWMDGDRLVLAAGGKLTVWDYDNANRQTLQPAVDGTVPAFDVTYKWVYAIAPVATSSEKVDPATQFLLTSTALRIPADQ